MKSEPEILYGVKETLDPHDWRIPAHTHPHHELLVFLRGHQCTVTANEDVAVGAGEVLFFPKGRVHEEWLLPDEAVVKYTLGFRWDIDLSALPCRLSDGQGRLTELADWISFEVPEGHPSEVGLPEPLLYGLVAELKRAAQRGGSELKIRAAGIIERDMNRIHSVEELANALGLSRSHMSRRFADEVGESPSEFIRTARLRRARQLLQTTGMGVKEVASAVGVSSEQQLCRMVRQSTGLTTRELRRQAR